MPPVLEHTTNEHKVLRPRLKTLQDCIAYAAIMEANGIGDCKLIDV